MKLTNEYERKIIKTLKNYKGSNQIGNVSVVLFVDQDTLEYYFFTKNYSKTLYFNIHGVLDEYVEVLFGSKNEVDYGFLQDDLSEDPNYVKLDNRYSQILLDKIIRERRDYFLENVNISEKQKKYCRCIAHVKSKQSDECIKSSFDRNINEKCYNPYAVCTSKIGRDSKYCDRFYDYDKLPLNEIKKLKT